MKSTWTAFLLLLAGSSFGQSFTEMKTLFWKQIHQSCNGNTTWEKSVADLSGEHPVQVIQYQIDCIAGKVTASGEPSNLPWSEFDYLFEQDFDNPYISPLMDIQRGPQGVSVKLKPEEAGNSPLKSASFALEDGKLISAKATVQKTNALYFLDIDLTVTFDKTGRYTSHTILTHSDVLLGSEVKTRVEGRIIP